MHINIALDALKKSGKGETLLLNVNQNHAFITVSKPLKWDKISYLEKWKLDHISELKPLVNRTQPAQILEDQEGNVKITFPSAKYNPLKIT